jgi:hypothetical protein
MLEEGLLIVRASGRFVILLVLIAATQASLAAGLFGLALAIGDSGRPVPGSLRVAVSVLGAPGIFLSGALQSRLGDPTSIFVGFGLGGVLWGGVIGLIILYGRRRRSRSASLPYDER